MWQHLAMQYSAVSFRYGRRDRWVLRDVTIGVEPGEIVVVQGRNGVGKSTLLQLAAGVLRPAGGRILDRPSRVGWVPERFPTDQPFTVERYLHVMASIAGLRGGAASDAVHAWIERLWLSPFRHVRLGELSKGTAQKVGLAQALLATPGLLVLDEPWEGLDGPTRDLVPEIVTEVVDGGGCVLISDHLGETARLPGATRWMVQDATVTPTGRGAAAPWRIEIEVPAQAGPETVATLRAQGHEIIRVRAGRLDVGETVEVE